jgi:hypothetical protein
MYVTDSRIQPSAPDTGPELTVDIVLRGRLARMLIKHAAVRKRDPAEVFADIVETVLREDMVDAVLDDRA